jgi:hypothetical protein
VHAPTRIRSMAPHSTLSSSTRSAAASYHGPMAPSGNGSGYLFRSLTMSVRTASLLDSSTSSK